MLRDLRIGCLAALAGGLLAGSVLHAAADDSMPRLRRQGSATQLIVDGKPFVMLAGELHNSSASSLAYMQGVWPKLKALNLNTVLATLSWELIEPQEGKFDFALIDGLIQQARQNDMKLVFLWFGSWKNGVSSYVPGWVKKDAQRFPCAQGSSNRNTKDIITPLSDANMQADARAFAAVMRRIREIDSTRHTVLMMQVENEVGIKPELRDLSALGDATFAKPVPAELMQYLTAHKDTLIPELKATWEKAGFKTAGTWREVFGEGGPADEIFSTWYYARYINAVAKAGKAAYPIPMYANAWLRGDGKLGTYPTGGPLAHVMDIWRAAGSDIDLYAPDIYLADFKGVCAEYTQSGNPLLIPEAQTDDAAVARAFWAIAQHNALCFAPFGIDHVPDNHPLGDGYAVLRQLMPLITAAQAGQGPKKMIGVYQQDRAQDQPEKPVMIGDYRANIRFSKRVQRDLPPYGLIIQTAADEFVVAGYGFDVNFNATAPGPRNTAILSVQLGHFANDQWVTDMQLNGDETGANYRAKLPINDRPLPGIDPARPQILKVRVYRHN